MPRRFSPTEAFHAFDLGASVLKFFPAEVLGPAGIKALRAVLPPDACIAAVGGVTPMTLAEFGRAGANAFGLGSALYQADMTMQVISDRARAFAEALAAFRDS